MPVVVRRAAAGELTHRVAEAVREIQLKHVSAGAFFDGERALMRAGGVAGSRRELPGQVDRRPHAQSGAQPDEKRRVVVTRTILEIRVVHPDRLDVDSAVVAKLARDRQAERGGVVVAEVDRKSTRLNS